VPVDEPALNLQALLTASDAARYARLLDDDGKPRVNVIVNWRARGWLPVATDSRGREIRDARGRPFYRLIDVVKAEAATKARGEKMARAAVRRDPAPEQGQFRHPAAA
jgi:hypothetical protein